MKISESYFPAKQTFKIKQSFSCDQTPLTLVIQWCLFAKIGVTRIFDLHLTLWTDVI